jgi:hypothetical protein
VSPQGCFDVHQVGGAMTLTARTSIDP